MNFTDSFAEAAYKERLAFKNLRSIYNLFPDDNHFIDIRPYDGMDEYDVLIQKHNEGSILKRLITELKIRMLTGDALQQAEENGYILESKKYKALKRIQSIDADLNKCAYICFTPTGTYLWFIDDLDKKGLLKPVNKEMNRATMASRDEKIDKKVYLLKTEWAYKRWDYTWSEDQYIKSVADEVRKKKFIEDKLKNDRDFLSQVLFNPLI